MATVRHAALVTSSASRDKQLTCVHPRGEPCLGPTLTRPIVSPVDRSLAYTPIY